MSAGYFGALGMPLASGREFTPADLAGGEGTILVNETLARRWNEPSPLNQTLWVRKAASTRSDFGDPMRRRVIGVVRDLDPSERGGSAMPVVYVPFTHSTWSHARLLVRTTVASQDALDAIANAVRGVDPAIPLSGPFVSPRRIEDVRAAQCSAERLNAALTAAFALVAVLLASVGMYGVISYGVTLGRRAIDVRMALGATSGYVVFRIVRQVVVISLSGLVVGVPIAAFMSRLVGGLLFQVTPVDPTAYAWTALLVLALAVASGYLPAARAGRSDPSAVLRVDGVS